MTRLQKEELHLIHNKKGTDRCENGKSYLKMFEKVSALQMRFEILLKNELPLTQTSEERNSRKMTSDIFK